jgi:hypothetical protein
MRTLKTLTTAALVTISFSAIAADVPGAKAGTKGDNKLSFPEISWGSPEDVNSPTIKSLKENIVVNISEMNWGTPEDVSNASVETLRNVPLIAAPEMNWGTNEDHNVVSAEALKGLYFAMPEMVRTDSRDFDGNALESLKNLNKQD